MARGDGRLAAMEPRDRHGRTWCTMSRSGLAILSAAAVAAVTAVVVVATDGSGSGRQSAAEPVVPGRPLEVSTRTRLLAGCPLTRARWRPPHRQRERRLWVAFGPTGGIYRVPAENVGPNGSLGVKIGWQRGPGVRGRVRVDALRLDQDAPAVHHRISAAGYGLTGLQASGIAFPTQGCWRVTARAGGASLTFVLLVLKPGETRPPTPRTHPQGVIVDCDRRSEANFPGAFTDPRNIVVGPLVLDGAGEPTPASVVREFGGNKFPLLVKAGHSVALRLPRAVRGFAGLAYGGLGKRPLPEGEVRLRDAAHTMTFVACEPGRPTRRYRPDGPSASYADGVQVTFWSGFVVLRRPACVPLDVYVDADPSPRRAVIDMGGGGCAR
jgi:hypothetical protein